MQDNFTTPTIQQDLNIESQKPKSKKVLFILIIVFLFSILFLIFVWNNNSNKSISPISQVTQLSSNLLPSPTPFLFREMTIPYLREREYMSSLGPLEKSSENSNYTSYITSYSSDGLKIFGLLTKPTGGIPPGGWPAIVFVHGYIPPDQYQTTKQYENHIDYLSKNGFVVFKIDLRGHGNSEGEPGGSYYSSDYIVDVLNAFSALQNSDFVNPQRIGLWGHSMAGNVVLRSFAVKPRISAIVIWAGAVYSYSDFQEYGINDSNYQPPQESSERAKKRLELFDVHGQFNKDSIFWKQVAATNYLNDLQGAIQIHHAANDNVVDIRYSQDLNNLLNQTSVIHELHEYPRGGHNIQGKSFTDAIERTVNFFKENLL